MIQSKHPQKLFAINRFLLITTAFLFIITSPVWCAGPLMDGSILDNSLGIALNSIRDGKFSEAIQNEEKALKISQELYGPLHPSLVPLYNNLGTLYRFFGEYEKAEQDYKWGLALLEQNFGPNDPRVAISLENLAALYSDLGRLPEAELAAKRALSLREANPTQDPQVLSQTQALLGQIELSLHDNSHAQKLFQKALGTLEKVSPSEPALSISFLNSLAQADQAAQNYAHAQTCLEKSLGMAQEKFHADDIQVADAMNRLADFFSSQGLDKKAQPLYASALKIDQRYVGSVYSYDSLPYLKRLAKAYFSLGDTKSCEALWEKILPTEKEAYNPRHPQVALDLFQLARVEWALGEKPNAIKYLQESINILKSYFPDDHPLVVQAQTELSKFEK
jgi:tetratricopeptide (TPR) repeat protein